MKDLWQVAEGKIPHPNTVKLMKHELTEIGWLGTSLKGTVTATFDQLVEKFGYPNILNDKTPQSDKVWWEWCIEFNDVDGWSHVATIYDWKEIGPSAARTGEYRWHVGGKSINSLWCVMEALEDV